MNLTAIFESWHVGDGNYPPLHRGQYVNLSFEFEPTTFKEVSTDMPEEFKHLGNGEYRFVGSVLRVYEEPDRHSVVIIQAGDFRFYVIASETGRFIQGQKYWSEGSLLLDHFYWVESLSEREDPPNLFFNLEVKRIRKVNLPEKFVARNEKGKSFPTRMVPGDYSASDVEELDTMEGQKFDEEFYVVDFDSVGLEGRDIPRTFIS